MNFSKDNLVNNDYIWPAENNKSVFSGTPSRRLFNRHNGEQVLFIINSYGELSDRFTVEDGRRIEEMIQNELPLQSKSELSVLHWLKEVLRSQLSARRRISRIKFDDPKRSLRLQQARKRIAPGNPIKLIFAPINLSFFSCKRTIVSHKSPDIILLHLHFSQILVTKKFKVDEYLCFKSG